MRIIHTSDWHIGRSLYGRKRYDEFAAFLDWLAGIIAKENIDALLIAGDVFDNISPGNRAQELYYGFLCRIAASPCRHVIITAGNHDSAAFLNAPREVLAFLNIHVIGCISDSIEDELLILPDRSGQPELIVCAVPYLRDRDIRKAEAGENREDKERSLVEGIRSHYSNVCRKAEAVRGQLGKAVPIIAMGHLFTSGGQTIDGDGVRDLYVGSLAHVDKEIFPPGIDYVALGHLHIPQKIGGCETIRYSGSPLPMGFGEAGQEKTICQVSFEQGKTEARCITVPCFQRLESIAGSWEHISGRLNELKSTGTQVWLDVIYEGKEVITDLRDRLDEITAGSNLEIIRTRNHRFIKMGRPGADGDENLADLDPEEVFKRCLEAQKVPAAQQEELIRTYHETIFLLQQETTGAE